MATSKSKDSEAEDIREEFEALKAQLAELVGTIKELGESKGQDVKQTLNAEREKLQAQAQEKIQAAQEMGDAGLEDLTNRVHENPLKSVAIAFGVGYVLSKILDK